MGQTQRLKCAPGAPPHPPRGKRDLLALCHRHRHVAHARVVAAVQHLCVRVRTCVYCACVRVRICMQRTVCAGERALVRAGTSTAALSVACVLGMCAWQLLRGPQTSYNLAHLQQRSYLGALHAPAPVHLLRHALCIAIATGS